MPATTAFAAWPEPVRGLDFLFTLGPAMPPLGCLPSSLYTFPGRLSSNRKRQHEMLQLHMSDRLLGTLPLQGLARGYPANGFPEFDRLSRRSFLLRSPVQEFFGR